MTLDTGPFCRTCGVHRVQAPGTECPGCIEDRRREEKAS